MTKKFASAEGEEIVIAYRFVRKWFNCSRLKFSLRERAAFSRVICCVLAVPAGVASANKSFARRVWYSCRRLVHLRHRSRLKKKKKTGLSDYLAVGKWMRLLSVLECFQQLF